MRKRSRQCNRNHYRRPRHNGVAGGGEHGSPERCLVHDGGSRLDECDHDNTVRSDDDSAVRSDDNSSVWRGHDHNSWSDGHHCCGRPEVR